VQEDGPDSADSAAPNSDCKMDAASDGDKSDEFEYITAPWTLSVSLSLINESIKQLTLSCSLHSVFSVQYTQTYHGVVVCYGHRSSYHFLLHFALNFALIGIVVSFYSIFNFYNILYIYIYDI